MFVLLLLSFLSLHATELDDRAQVLLHAKDLKSLKAKIDKIEEKKILESRCEFELNHKLVPKTCYKLEISKEKLQIVDQACERNVLVMTEEVSLAGLSPYCKKLVSDKNKDLIYSKEEKRASSLVLKK